MAKFTLCDKCKKCKKHKDKECKGYSFSIKIENLHCKRFEQEK